MKTKYRVRWSAYVSMISLFASVLFIGILVYFIRQCFIAFNELSFVIAILTLTALLYMAMRAPIYVETTDKGIALKRFAGKIRVSYDEITDINVYQPKRIGFGMYRIGGVFGYTGVFWDRELHEYAAYVGDMTQSFYVKTKKGRTVLLSCENREELIATVVAKMQEVDQKA